VIRAQLEKWLDEAEDAEIEEPIKGIVCSHLDYARGHPLYAASYRTIAKGPKPDRIVLLGSNQHAGCGHHLVAVLCNILTAVEARAFGSASATELHTCLVRGLARHNRGVKSGQQTILKW
jgi:hypothetical protein